MLEVDGRVLEISNLDKVMYPGNGFTKAHVIDYYTRVAAFLLPHIKDRPVTLKRFPDGVTGEFFYEKDAPSFTPAWIKTFPIRRRSGESHIRYILINDLPTLVWSASMANLEIHPFLARAPSIDSPTMIVFDLDPGGGSHHSPLSQSFLAPSGFFAAIRPSVFSESLRFQGNPCAHSAESANNV
jgi:bifunctional non-homologous end joining protein LigD